METTLLGHFNSTAPAQLLIAGIWQGLLLTTAAWAAFKLADRCGVSLRASTRFALWLIVFVLVALLPVLALVETTTAASHTMAIPGARPALFLIHLQTHWAYILEGLWLVACLISLGRLAAGGCEMRSLLQGSDAIAFDNLEQGLQDAVSRRRGRRVEVRLSDAVDTPSAISFFHPAVIVPRSLWTDLSPVEQRHILLHEIAHIERGDGWTNLLQKLLRALCPLNPALLLAERHLCRERERACDEAVLDASGNARAYASCLTRLAESRLVRRAASLAPGLWKQPSELASRVDHILHRRRTPGPWWSRGVLATSLLASAAGAVWLQRVPALIGFTNNSQPAAHPVIATEGRGRTAILVRANLVQANDVGAVELPSATYHDAVFHPDVEKASAVQEKLGTKATRLHRRRQPVFRPSLHLIELENAHGERQLFTLIVWTLQMPRSTRASGGRYPVTFTPDFSFPETIPEAIAGTWFSSRI